MRLKKKWFIVSVSILLASCGGSIPRLPANGPTPLVVSSCPKLTPLSDPSFGATANKLVEVANQYRDCREAAMAK